MTLVPIEVVGRWPLLRSLARYIVREYPQATSGELARWLMAKVTPAIWVPPEKRPLGDGSAGETLLYAIQAISDARDAERLGFLLEDDAPFVRVTL